jgi:hypothetical protein
VSSPRATTAQAGRFEAPRARNNGSGARERSLAGLWLGCLGSLAACTTPPPEEDPDNFPPAWRREPAHGWLERGYLHIGERNLVANNLPFNDSQLAIGLEIVGAPPKNLIEFELGLFGAANSAGPGSWIDAVFGEPQAELLAGGGFEDAQQTSAFELSLGVRKEFGLFDNRLRPFLGLGLAGIQQRRFEIFDGNTESFSDADVAYYGQAGLRFLFSPGVSLGFTLRRLDGTDLNLGGLATSADYFQWSILFSFFA